MITIIKAGKVDKKIFKCKLCGCKFESDEYLTRYDGNISNRIDYNECPTCNNECTLNKKSV